MPERVGIGIVGCGNIAQRYLEWISASYSGRLAPIACYDAVAEQAARFAETFHLRQATSLDDLLQDPAISIVANLTNPAAHHAVSKQALLADKHVFSEKPLALTLADAHDLVNTAMARGLRLGCAPSVMLLAPQRTAWHLVRSGQLGQVHEVWMSAVTAGHEAWHPSPRYYYQAGAGPLLDFGVYPLTVATTILGPVARVWAHSGLAIPQRTIATGPLAGQQFTAEVPDHITGLLSFASGPLGTVHASFAISRSQHPAVEIHGTEASLWLSDWQRPDAIVRIAPRGSKDWQEVPQLSATVAPNWSRTLVDLADAVSEGRNPRASGEQARHVLEVMLGLEASAQQGGSVVEMTTTFVPSTPLPEEP